ncbi:MAG: transglutaminaseTgpA domain-containing protein [Pirellulales bacterium]
MSLLRLVQINLAIVAVLGTLLLGSAQGSVALPLLAVVSASAAFYWTDLRGRIRLGGGLANLAALVAVAMSVSQVVRSDASEQLVAIANLLIYLQTILLFQEKTVRVGWQLLSLSLLQVVVAAAIGDSILFGVLVILFLLFGLSGVALLCCYGESLAHGVAFGTSGSKRKTRWGLNWQNAVRSPSERGSAQAAVVEPPRHFYRSLARCLMFLAAGSVAVAAVLFVAVPRYSDARSMTQGMRRNVGMTSFTDKVDLNSSGRRIFENSAIVMRVSLLDDATGDAFPFQRDLYLRGGVAYDYEAGNWKPVGSDDGEGEPLDRTGRGVVRQVVDIEQMPSGRLFSVYPIAGVYGDDRIKSTPWLRRDPYDMRMELQIGTTGFHLGKQQDVMPCRTNRIDLRRWTRLSPPDRNATDAPPPERKLAELIAWASGVLADHDLSPDDRVGLAQLLEDRLKNSGEFRYSLAMPERNADIDPIEDFVTEHRQGNCEFFASALVLMLRSQGIPARIVMGYRSADWNPVGGYLQVRQLHAHAWAEAYLEPSQVSEAMKSPNHDYRRGAWLRLDPTPGDESFATTTGNYGFWARAKNLFDHVDLLWRNYIVGFDRERQRRFVYSPLEGIIDSARWGVLALAESIAAVVRVIVDAVGWLGLIAGIVVCWYAIREVARRWPTMPRLAWWTRLGGWLSLRPWRRGAAKPSRPRITFYDRFERIAARAGYRRLPQQTPLEFAQAIGGQLFDMPSRRIAARAPRQVVEAFYRVRYGGHALADAEAAEVELALIDLERVLTGANA